MPLEEKLYTWWSYRAPDWEAANKGRRLDHIWVTRKLAPRLKNFETAAPPAAGSAHPTTSR